MVVEQWQIYLLDLNPVIGSEQSGKRPCVVVSANFANKLQQVTILPITSMKDTYTTIYPNEVFVSKEVSGLSKDSIALAHQIRSVDKRRLYAYVSKIQDESIIKQLQYALRFQLDLD